MRVNRESADRWLRRLLGILMLALFVGLGAVLVSLPESAIGLKAAVAAEMDRSGVTHPVTAVLINFRGYDTLLEMAVLLLALLGVWSLTPAAHVKGPAPGAVLERLTQLYAPLMLLVCGYLLWRGAEAPGGAFQAGAVLGALGVLFILSSRRIPPALRGWRLRLALVFGLLVFITVAAWPAWRGEALLQYPPPFAGYLILLIEAAATLSIGVTLAALFLGGQPGDDA